MSSPSHTRSLDWPTAYRRGKRKWVHGHVCFSTCQFTPIINCLSFDPCISLCCIFCSDDLSMDFTDCSKKRDQCGTVFTVMCFRRNSRWKTKQIKLRLLWSQKMSIHQMTRQKNKRPYYQYTLCLQRRILFIPIINKISFRIFLSWLAFFHKLMQQNRSQSV